MNRLRSRRRARPPLVPLAAAGAAVAAAGVAAVIYTRRRHAAGSDGRRKWNCECGQEYLVTGIDRHRVYWLPEADHSDPLLGRDCVSCGAELPAGHKAALV